MVPFMLPRTMFPYIMAQNIMVPTMFQTNTVSSNASPYLNTVARNSTVNYGVSLSFGPSENVSSNASPYLNTVARNSTVNHGVSSSFGPSENVSSNAFPYLNTVARNSTDNHGVSSSFGPSENAVSRNTVQLVGRTGRGRGVKKCTKGNVDLSFMLKCEAGTQIMKTIYLLFLKWFLFFKFV